MHKAVAIFAAALLLVAQCSAAAAHPSGLNGVTGTPARRLLETPQGATPGVALAGATNRALLATAATAATQGQCWTIGTAPFCAASCSDCGDEGAECVNGNFKEGASCWTGRKVRCCR